MHELQLIAAAIVEETKSHRLPDGRVLYSALLESHNPHHQTFDGFLISDLEECIKAVLLRTPNEQKAIAYNQIASEDGLDPVGPDDDDLDIWIFESFINPSLDELMQQHKMAN
jgi:hypothetical protein